MEVDAELASSGLQDQQQTFAANTAEPMPSREKTLALVMECNVVPVGEMVADLGRADRIVCVEIGKCFVGQHHAPPEGVVGFVAFEDRDVDMRRPHLQ